MLPRIVLLLEFLIWSEGRGERASAAYLKMLFVKGRKVAGTCFYYVTRIDTPSLAEHHPLFVGMFVGRSQEVHD